MNPFHDYFSLKAGYTSILIFDFLNC